MASDEINANNKRGMQGVYAGTSAYNAQAAQIQKELQKINTTFLAKIESCSTSPAGGAKTVSATPLTAQVDGNGNAVPTPTYQHLPHYRVQAGIAALIVDPVAGDIGVFSCAKRDISNISAGTNATQVPGSFRSFSPADAVMVGSVHTKAPTVYIEIKQDNTVLIHAPAGVTIETDSSVTIKAKSSVVIDSPETTINGHLTVKNGLSATGGAEGGIAVAGDIVADTVSLKSHTHSGVQPGSGNTGAPNA